MVAERAVLPDPVAQVREGRGPIDMPVGNDSGGPLGSADGTRRMELSKFVEQGQPKPAATPPSPEVLARKYLRKAGFAPADLDDAAPALKATEDHSTLEKLVKFSW